MDETLDLQQTLEAAKEPIVTAARKRHLHTILCKSTRLLEERPETYLRLSGDRINDRDDGQVVTTLVRDIDSLSDSFAKPLSTAQILAISVLADDDYGAAAALADLLQEQGVDAIAAAENNERLRLRRLVESMRDNTAYTLYGGVDIVASRTETLGTVLKAIDGEEWREDILASGTFTYPSGMQLPDEADRFGVPISDEERRSLLGYDAVEDVE